MSGHARMLKWALVLVVALAWPAQAQTVVKYVHTDMLGSVVAMTDANRNVIERREYEPYGAQLTPAVQDGPGYTGHVQDAATGLVYMQQRYYDPQLGVFLSVDPVTAYSSPISQFHRYRYANNNPYRFTDPDGRQSRDDVRPPPSGMGPFIDWIMAHPDDRSSMGQMIAEQFGFELSQPKSAEDVALSVAVAMSAGAGVAGGARRGLGASRGFDQARRYIESTTDGLGRTGGRSARRTTQFEGRGGEASASRLFDRLTRGESGPSNGGRLGALGDGSRVHMSTRTMQDGTRETSVRIQSQRTGSRIRDEIKVRFRENPQ